MLTAFLVYCYASLIIGVWLAASVRYDRWRRDTRRVITYSPNKDALGYLLAVIFGCPLLNLVAVVLILYGRAQHMKERTWLK